MTEKKLLEYKEKIETAKNELAELKGQEKTLMQQLKTEYDCENLDDAKALLESLKQKVEKYDTLLADKESELQENFGAYL